MAVGRDHRKWTAKVLADGVEFEVESQWDTLRETEDAGERLASEIVQEGLAEEALVKIYKQLKADPEPKFDRDGAYVWVSSGVVLVSA
jgi:hypothetical protein